MADGARTTRLAALMAGNGYAFVQVVGWILALGSSHSFTTVRGGFPVVVVTLLIPFAGAAAGYIALRLPSSAVMARYAENVSAGCIIFAIFAWLMNIYVTL